MRDLPLPTFDELLARHERDVLRVCRSILRDEHLGADAAQETFVRLWRRITSGRRPEHSPAWLRRVAVSTSLDLARKRSGPSDVAASSGGADASLPEDVTRDARRPESAAPRPEAEARGTEIGRRLELALSELPEGQRTIFVLRHSGDLTLAEVAETLDLALPTVKTQFARACLKLQEKLALHRPDRDERT
jgi:RNA polymerase sigma-70 factor (ECF subfamily)